MVNGLGGIFLKTSDPKLLARWYEDHLGIGFGTSTFFTFNWKDLKSGALCHTDLSLFPSNTNYFYPSDHEVMINLRVENLDTIRIRLKNDRQEVIDKIEVHEYGRFGWVVDPEGNKIELWEPPVQQLSEFGSESKLGGEVTGLGGIFIKCSNPTVLSQWYSKYLGLFFDNAAHQFLWNEPGTEKPSSTVLSFFPEGSNYFSPSEKRFMLCLRVKNLDSLLRTLAQAEIEIIGQPQVYEYGKFGWFIDPDGNKVELWEPTEAN